MRQADGTCVTPHDPVIARVHGGYSHEFTTAQVHTFLAESYGDDYQLPNPNSFAVFEDHLLYAHHNPKFVPFMDKVQTLRDLQVEFQKHTGVRDYSAKDGVSPGICHQVAREEFINVGDFIQATDSFLHGWCRMPLPTVWVPPNMQTWSIMVSPL